MQQKRAEFRDEIAGLDVRALVFVDESGLDTHTNPVESREVGGGRLLRRCGLARPAA